MKNLILYLSFIFLLGCNNDKYVPLNQNRELTIRQNIQTNINTVRELISKKASKSDIENETKKTIALCIELMNIVPEEPACKQFIATMLKIQQRGVYKFY